MIELLMIAYFSMQSVAHRSMDVTMGYIMENYDAGIQLEEACHNDHLVLDHDMNFRSLTDSEIRLICQCVQTEAGGESNVCQECVATVILNRWLNPEKYPDTIAGVIYEPNQFAVDEGIEPDVGVRVAVHNAIVYYNTYQMQIPYQVYWFRADHYHENIGMPYIHYDNTYFSIDENAVVN